MKKIYKYRIPLEKLSVVCPFPANEFSITMQSNEPILKCDIQKELNKNSEDMFIWAFYDEKLSPIERKFLILGTGYAIPEEKNLLYIGSVIQYGYYVWHLFEDITQVTA